MSLGGLTDRAKETPHYVGDRRYVNGHPLTGVKRRFGKNTGGSEDSIWECEECEERSTHKSDFEKMECER